jgi:type I restriction enzyme M protein
MTDVVQKLWGFCNALRDGGMSYGHYIEQLTYLLFLKMADERNMPIPEEYSWKSLVEKTGMELLEHYQDSLKNLAKEGNILADIFAGALSQFREPVNLKKLIGMIDGERWSAIDVDIKGAAYEGLLQKYATDEKGAGQYFTPRELIRAIVKCIDPKIGETIHDPALGTGGFLLGALEHILKETKDGADLTREQNEFLLKKTFSGNELVLETKRLAMMNIYLHGIEADVYYGDSLGEGRHVGKKYKVIMTNPPFGIKSGGVTPTRSDFNVTTSNKQLNFVQHVMSALDNGGRAAMVAPDNVLFDSGAGTRIRKILLEDFDLHTILRLPIGTFTPYSPGVKANVIFFDKPGPTKAVWIYDLRTDIEKITKKEGLTVEHFEEFIGLYHDRKETERFKSFPVEELKKKKRDYNLDIFWLKSKDSASGEYEEPEVILESIKESEERIIDEIDRIMEVVTENEERENYNSRI